MVGMVQKKVKSAEQTKHEQSGAAAVRPLVFRSGLGGVFGSNGAICQLVRTAAVETSVVLPASFPFVVCDLACFI
jgi:hypothetical protein